MLVELYQPSNVVALTLVNGQHVTAGALNSLERTCAVSNTVVGQEDREDTQRGGKIHEQRDGTFCSGRTER